LLERQLRGVLVLQHGGSRLGSGSVVRLAPEYRFGVIILANRTGSFLPKTLERITEHCLPLAPEAASEKKPPRSLTNLETERLVGRYVNHPDELSVEIFLDGGALMLRRPGDKSASPLLPTGDGLFSVDGQDLSVILGADGAPAYVHLGGRALKRSGVRP
jgi:hypothetical protein